MDTPGTPNPLCACGCGFEVALPNNRYIQGHAGAIRLTEDERRELKKMLGGSRVSSYKIAARFGRSQAQVLNWRERGVPEQRPAPRVLREEDLERSAAAKRGSQAVTSGSPLGQGEEGEVRVSRTTHRGGDPERRQSLCKSCATKFVSIRSNQRYCSTRCRRRERRHRRQLTPHGLARRRERDRKRYAANPMKYRQRAKRSAADPNKGQERLARRRELARKRRAADPEKYRAYERKYGAAHPDRHERYYAAHREKYQESSMKRYVAHREEINEKRRKRYAANPEKRREPERKRRSAHREELNEKRRKRYAANPEKHREYDRKRYAANPENRRAISRKSYHARREEIRERVRRMRADQRRNLADAERLRAVLADLPSKPLAWQRAVPFLLANPALSNEKIQILAGMTLSKETMRTMLREYGLPARKGGRRKSS